MMDLNLHSSETGAVIGSVAVADEAFNAPYNEALVHQVVTAYLAASRAGTKAQKSRSQVSGGGAKPFRQKGTGRARAGSTRSPLWRKGGVTFAAVPRDYSQKVNRKMYRGAVRSILSELVRQDRLMLIDGIALNAPKTKDLAARLKAVGREGSLIVTESLDVNLELASRNLPYVNVCRPDEVDPVRLVSFESVLVTQGAIQRIQERLA
jgi:large subunit ribosomal protein L4